MTTEITQMADAFVRFLGIIARLRGEDGCAWDQAQTHESLKSYLLEESYEVLDAIDNGNAQELAGELGDLLLQVVLHTQIAAEAEDFNMLTVLQAVSEKMIRRHPHVFGSLQQPFTPLEVDTIWQQAKQAEREAADSTAAGQTVSLMEVPRAMPALMRAQKVQERAAGVGFDWSSDAGIYDKIREELLELENAPNPANQKEELGDLLFSLVNLARFWGYSAEEVLSAATEKFRTRFAVIEQAKQQQQLRWDEMTLEQMDYFWEQAKENVPTATNAQKS